jgi:hypothetical protein
MGVEPTTSRVRYGFQALKPLGFKLAALQIAADRCTGPDLYRT